MVEIGDLSMRPHYIAVDDSDEPSAFECLHCAPIGGLATPWLLGNKGLFRIDLAIIRKEAEQPERYLALGGGEAHTVLQKVFDQVKALQQELR